MEVYWAFFGLLFVLVLTIKYFAGKELDRRAVVMFVLGFAVLAGGQLLTVLIALGSATGAIVMGGIAATGAGALALYGLYIELVVTRADSPPPRPAPAPRPAAHAPAHPPAAHAAPRPPVRPAAPPPRRPPPAQPPDEGEA
ncbi:MAG: hypothetical protein IT385_06895 [Deltaproteobacteria bacterium]|nr:hypothetical protein [Deltaproteobacteria bacterium]